MSIISKPKWIFFALAILAVLLFPFETTVVPTQEVLVVSDDMRPVKGALVRQIWQHYSLEREVHEEDLRTDETGRLRFAVRTIRANLLRRLLAPIVNVASQGVHASFGVHTHMLHLGGGTSTSNGPVEPRPGEVVYRLRS
jgi:hypothetical protein